MNVPSIIITLDYELPGNGSGDVRQLIIEPTERLLHILNSRQIKMTVFFELEEFLVFRKYAKELKKCLGYDPSLIIEKQLEKIVNTGHEIGLHIHPQWIGATFNGNRFNLSNNNRCLFDVHKTKKEMNGYFRERVAELKKLVRRYAPSQQILCFRAGALSLRPEKLTLKVLQSLGIQSDSSVVKGLYRQGKATNVDYRRAPHNSGFWRVNENVCRAEEKGTVVEFPIYSIIKPEYKKLTFNRIKRKFFSFGHPVTAICGRFSEIALPTTPWGIIKHFFQKSPIKFDFCHMTSKEMLSFLSDSEKESKLKSNYPLTMIGHSKEFFNDKEFACFLDKVISAGHFEFRTMGQTLKLIERSGI